MEIEIQIKYQHLFQSVLAKLEGHIASTSFCAFSDKKTVVCTNYLLAVSEISSLGQRYSVIRIGLVKFHRRFGEFQQELKAIECRLSLERVRYEQRKDVKKFAYSYPTSPQQSRLIVCTYSSKHVGLEWILKALLQS